jgi:endoglucanase
MVGINFAPHKYSNKFLRLIMPSRLLSFSFKILLFTIISLPYLSAHSSPNSRNQDTTVVEKYGQLSVNGTYVVDQHGNPITLRGMSLFWSQWMGRFYNSGCIESLKNDWKCTVIRVAMGVESGGYLTNPQAEMNKVKTVIDACINAGIYVIVDWHDHNAHDHQSQAIGFFKQIAQLYGNHPNILYEIYNEPVNVSWTNVVKPYSVAVIDSIRKIDPDNIILVGSPTWSQDVDTASRNPIDRTNIAYSLHFYTATHKQSLRNKATTAINNGIALFANEWGTCESTGSGVLDYTEVEKWLSFMESKKISWCNWSVCDKDETSAALKVGAASNGGWPDSMLSASGTLIKSKLKLYNDSTTRVDSKDESFDFQLYQNFPNPFNPTTTIEYELPSAGNVKIEVYDLLGSKIKTLVKNYESSGRHSVAWHGITDEGQKVSSGIYFYNLSFENRNQFKKAVFMN